MFNVFALIDEQKPEEYRYIGFTTQRLQKRLSDMVSEVKFVRCTSKLAYWIKDLIDENRNPDIVSLFEFDDLAIAKEKVQELILQFLNEGHPILNGLGSDLKIKGGGRPNKIKEK